MSALSDFYAYARAENIGVYAYPIGFRTALSVRDGARRATFFDFSQLRTVRSLNGAAAHESGHHHTGAYHKVDSPFQVWQQAEYRADRWLFETYLSPCQLRDAFRAGYTRPDELADYFDLPEQTVRAALHYWTECRGFNFNKEDAV